MIIVKGNFLLDYNRNIINFKYFSRVAYYNIGVDKLITAEIKIYIILAHIIIREVCTRVIYFKI